MVPWTQKAKKILLKHWKFDSLKDKQFDVINGILAGKDVVALLPTGYGKSLCYLLLPLLMNKTLFIISPLISLMEDQKNKLISMGIPVSVLHHNNENKKTEIEEIIKGKIKIVYMSPEYSIGGGLKLATDLNDNNQLGYLAIDESHCMSSWGHDFRPTYLKLIEYRNLFPHIPILAVTATAKTKVIDEITKALKLNNPEIVRGNFDRPNLYIECKSIDKILVKNKPKQKPYDSIIIEYINKYKDFMPSERIIVYVISRRETEEISTKLNNFYGTQISNSYHAGLSKNEREKIQNDFINNDCNVIISTVAFGMGIDQIVKCVLIFGCPSSIEEYYQQIGRGGRDGLPCETVFYFDASKQMMKKKMIEKESNNMNKIENLSKIKEYFNTKKCRRQYILEYFEFGPNENYFHQNGFTCKNCDNCINYELIDITEHIWDYYINNNKTNKKIDLIINELKLKNILIDWKTLIELNNYSIETLPELMKIKINSFYKNFI
jgi:RecQ family ATP-dependent DNA helicase